MKTIKQLLTTIAVLLCSVMANAHINVTKVDTFYTAHTDGIAYRITSDENLTVEVVYADYIYNSECDCFKPYKYSGNIKIPTTIIMNEKQYTVTSIGKGAFEYCSSLTSISIPNSVTSIGSSAFEGCSSLTSISIPDSVTSINASTFRDCSSLISISIPNSVTSIGAVAFWGCSSLTSISIPDSVTSINAGTFSDCSSLISISIPNSVTSIGSSAFGGCSSLTSISIPNSVTSIGGGAFYDCSSLISISIPYNVTSIGDGTFDGCSSLISISIPDSVTSIEESAFRDCSSLTSISIPNNVTSINASTFNGCSSLSSISIPNNVTKIRYKAFFDCNKLRTIQIGESIETIDENAFAGCTALYSIGVDAIIPPIIDATTFSNVSRTAQIKVPCNAVAAYQASNYWNEFTNYIESPYSITVTSNDNTMGNAFIIKQPTCQDIIAQVQAQALPGYEFVKWSDGFTENPHTIYVTSDTTITAEFRVASTPVENIFNSQISFYTTDGTLHIEGVEGDYQIYTTTGQCVYSGKATTLTLPRGIYLIVINGNTQKIAL